ncbi:MAG: hypothetical protein GY810_04810 [Aureispira sp.]|nr:hypothetical protein [Aureispira sp.]
MPRKKKTEGDPEIHKDLNGFEIHINEFGEIITSYSVDKLNTFLDKNVDDKKLRDRDDLKDNEKE